MKNLKLSLITALILLISTTLIYTAYACTQVALFQPLIKDGEDLVYAGDADNPDPANPANPNPIIVKLRNSSATVWVVKLYREGTDASSGWGYTYDYDFIAIGNNSSPAYKQMNTAMNTTGSAFMCQNAGGNGGSDNYRVREEAASRSGNYVQMKDYILPESTPNTVLFCGEKDGKAAIGRLKREVLLDITEDNPFWVLGNSDSTAEALFHNSANWGKGDPTLLDVRDTALIIRKFNSGANFAVIHVPKHKIMWTTVADKDNSPFIPFDLDDPYVYDKFSDGTYTERYSPKEIIIIEDAIMAPDGTVIGDVRDIQAKIAEGWFSVPDIEPPTIPQNLRDINIGATSIEIAWDASTDNVGVAGYKIFRDGVEVGQTSDTTYTDTGLIPETFYRYNVSAFDFTPNESAQSSDLNRRTGSIPTLPYIGDLDTGQDGWAYQDDLFRGTNNPDYAKGEWKASLPLGSGGFELETGGIDQAELSGMSAGISQDFNVIGDNITVELTYRMDFSTDHESGEWCQMLFAVDDILYGTGGNEYIAELQHDGETTDIQTVSIPISLSDGICSFKIGLYHNEKSAPDEWARLYIDSIRIETEGGILLGDVDENSEITVYDAVLCAQIALGIELSELLDWDGSGDIDTADAAIAEQVRLGAVNPTDYLPGQRADFDQSGDVTIYDAALIVREALGL
ncbi:MAG: hypothetical protein HQ572_01200 [Candidatus Omnitrophica bacterium]|nr:hypothetical protein [Candidatus Omnitrophota bacterium]